MIFKRTRPQVVAALPSTELVRDADGEDHALDTLVAMLRAFGRAAPDTEACTAEHTRALVDRWVRHATLGQALDGRGGAVHRRDWRGLAHAFAQHRQTETAAVAAGQQQLRATIWSFVGSMDAAVAEDRIEDRELEQQLRLLRAAVDGGSPSELRTVAEATAARFDAALAGRRERQRRQLAELGERLRALGDQLEDARRESALDPLTGLANRKALDVSLQRIVQLHGFVPTPACLLMIDLDGFKRLNDTHGHQAGDEALQRVAACLSKTFLRKCDFVCRYGGDEFAVVMRDTPAAAARLQAERLRARVAAERLPGARAVQLSLSVGIAALHAGEPIDQWVRRADRALYQAKADGRDRVVEAVE